MNRIVRYHEQSSWLDSLSHTFDHRAMPSSAEDELYITPILTPVCALDATEAFNGSASICS